MKRKAYDGIYNQYIKRGIDFCLALVGLIIAAIPMAIVAVAIKAESKGPVIFKQDRIGYKGKVYKMYKFRSMCVEAEKGGVYSDNKDSRVTKVGKFIRATSIDELPQLVNVLKGDMALLGDHILGTDFSFRLHITRGHGVNIQRSRRRCLMCVRELQVGRR